MEFHHIGLRAEEEQPNENYIPFSKVWVTNPEHSPHQIEWLRYEPDSPTPEIVKNTPHVAFRVDRLDPYLEGEEVVIPPFEVGGFVKAAFIVKHGLVYEFMEFEPDREWFDK